MRKRNIKEDVPVQETPSIADESISETPITPRYIEAPETPLMEFGTHSAPTAKKESIEYALNLLNQSGIGRFWRDKTGLGTIIGTVNLTRNISVTANSNPFNPRTITKTKLFAQFCVIDFRDDLSFFAQDTKVFYLYVSASDPRRIISRLKAYINLED